MDNIKEELADKLKAATYVLVTVGRNPSVDQLSALIGLTLVLNKQGKHAAAVFSGDVPSTLEFLQPEHTIEKTTDSLRDFIIALDKSKADKLRYKVEDDVVRIFITPYKTSITEHDLEFSQGDFNVDVVVALGVGQQEDLDEAIVAHGRILHDATVATVNTSAQGDLGSIHWQNAKASSLSEMITDLASMLGPNLIDNQIATALLTGIVAETERFRNDKTTSQVMNAAAILMAAGANQQLVANQLEKPIEAPELPVNDSDDWKSDDHHDQSNDDKPHDSDDETDDQPPSGPTEPEEPPKPDDGSIAIDHAHDYDDDKSQAEEPEPDARSVDVDDQLAAPVINDAADDQVVDSNVPEPPANDVEPEASLPEPESANDQLPENLPEPMPDTLPNTASIDRLTPGSKIMTEPPTLGGQLTANSKPEVLEPSSDPMSSPVTGQDQLLTRGAPLPTSSDVANATNAASATDNTFAVPLPEPSVATVAEPPLIPQPSPAPIEPVADQSLSNLESAVQAVVPAEPTEPLQPEVPATEASEPPASLDFARDEVLKALNSGDQPLPPVAALNAQPMMDSLHSNDQSAIDQPPAGPVNSTPVDDSTSMAFDPAAQGISEDALAPTAPVAVEPTVIDPNAAPPVPPPIPFSFNTPESPTA